MLTPLRVHVPVPFLTREVTPILGLSTMAPAISPGPAVVPVRMSILLPVPEAVKLLVNLSKPDPDCSRIAVPVVTNRSMGRSLVLPAPMYRT